MNTNYFLNLIAGNVFGTKTTPDLPSAYYLGLSATAPLEDGTCTGEPSGSETGYARVALTSLSEPANGVISNTASFDFSESTASWGEMQYYVVYDAPSGGNLLFGEKLAYPITVDAGTVITMKAGELRIRVVTPSA